MLVTNGRLRGYASGQSEVPGLGFTAKQYPEVAGLDFTAKHGIMRFLGIGFKAPWRRCGNRVAVERYSRTSA